MSFPHRKLLACTLGLASALLAVPRPAAKPVVVVEVLFGESAAIFDSKLLNQVS